MYGRESTLFFKLLPLSKRGTFSDVTLSDLGNLVKLPRCYIGLGTGGLKHMAGVDDIGGLPRYFKAIFVTNCLKTGFEANVLGLPAIQ